MGLPFNLPPGIQWIDLNRSPQTDPKKRSHCLHPATFWLHLIDARDAPSVMVVTGLTNYLA